MTKTVAFDPGYSKFLTSFINNVEMMYYEINKFKNLGQKKFKFKTYYPQIIKLIEQNIAFYLGCMLWAEYVVSQGDAEITGNHCLGLEYKEEIELQEINYICAFLEYFGKDTKYYLNQNFVIEDWKLEILEKYKEFARLNKGFVEAKLGSDIKLPESLKTLTEKDIEKIHDTITKDVVIKGDFSKLYELKDLII